MANKNNKHFGQYLTDHYDCRLRFKTITENDTITIINNIKPKKSCSHDQLSTELLKHIMNPLIQPLTHVINQMINTGLFPDNLKIAKVKPLFKKGDKSLFTNYRPISLLPAISKVFEKVIFKELYAYFTENDIFFKSQYGFRSKHSTELAALELMDRIVLDLENKGTPFSIFIDLSKAFDTLNHDILLQKLKYYGIKGISNDLINNYLTNRRQYVEIDGISSKYQLISTGVPQGSILGPLLFIIYMNDINKSSDKFDFILYADDTSLYSIINKFKDRNTNNTNNMINKDISHITTWLESNKLSLNIDKTKAMLFHQPQKKISKPTLKINEKIIEFVPNFNFLGMNFNENLSWKPHIDNICNKISRSIGILNKLKHYIPLHIRINIYNSLILPYINYGILLWGNNHEKVTKLQKKAMRIIHLKKYNSHTEPLFKKLHMLKVEDIFKLHQLKFFYKFINKDLPDYFKSFPILRNSTIHNHSTRNQKLFHKKVITHEFAKKTLRNTLINTLNNCPDRILDKVHTHSQWGFTNYAKNDFINEYTLTCLLSDCFICQQS